MIRAGDLLFSALAALCQLGSTCWDVQSDRATFNYDRELRWKQQGDRYDVLLLSRIALPLGFDAIGQGWCYRDRLAHFYPKTETRFPRSIDHPKVKIAQRYFIDAQTAVVQFVALTLKP